MINWGVWHKVKRLSIPNGRRCIKCKWIFKVKRDGVFCACLVACGYSQIPRVNYSENYVPIVNNVAWQILLNAKLVWKLSAIIINVDTAFLYGDLEEEIYMQMPEGMMGFSDKVLL